MATPTAASAAAAHPSAGRESPVLGVELAFVVLLVVGAALALVALAVPVLAPEPGWDAGAVGVTGAAGVVGVVGVAGVLGWGSGSTSTWL
jgi:hypothetical protein